MTKVLTNLHLLGLAGFLGSRGRLRQPEAAAVLTVA